jgi:hypothetical protein
VTIGDGAVIGACSLVTRNIPARALAYGVPAEVVRILDEDDEKIDEAEANASTLEEALKMRSRPATTTGSSSTRSSSLACGGSEKAKVPPTTATTAAAAAAGIYDQTGLDRSQPHAGGVRDSHGLTRAEILALIALTVSFMGCFFLVALVVVSKRENNALLPAARDL